MFRFVSSHAGDKGCNCGTKRYWKTTLLRDVIKGNPAIRLGENVKMAYLLDAWEIVDEATVRILGDTGFDTDDPGDSLPESYGLRKLIYSSVCDLIWWRKESSPACRILNSWVCCYWIANQSSGLTYSQLALEQAVEKYNEQC